MSYLRPFMRYFRLFMCLFLSVLFHPLSRHPARRLPWDRCPAKRHSTCSVWTPVGFSGRNAMFRGGGVQFYGARGRFAGHPLRGRQLRSRASRSIELAQRFAAAADYRNGRRRCLRIRWDCFGAKTSQPPAEQRGVDSKKAEIGASYRFRSRSTGRHFPCAPSRSHNVAVNILPTG